jgi:PKD repeat protein
MSTLLRPIPSRWPVRLSLAAVAAAVAVGCGDDTPPTRPSPQPTPTPPAAVTVTAGRITQSPVGVGIVLATTFTFTAEGFTASDNSALTYTWDFGDGGRQTGGATITHVYPGSGLFTVGVTAATAGGASASASLGSVAAATVDGRWALQDATGAIVMRNTSLSQNGTAVSGDDTMLNCRFAVSGSVAQSSIDLTWTRAPNDCAGMSRPLTVRFTGTVVASASGFLGTLDTGVPARLFLCTGPSCS